MCGHVGVFGKDIRSGDIDVFKELLWMDQLRGKHGTGIGVLAGTNGISYHKMAVDADEYLSSNSFAKFSKKHLTVSARAIMGHNRYATIGDKTESKNAHPFMHDHIICAHNGTLDSRDGLAGNAADFPVDSDQLAYTISQKKLDTFIAQVEGAFALVWLDNSSEASETGGTINFLRNKERPMWIAKVKGREVWFYASERHMISVSAERKNRNYELEFEELPSGEHWCYELTHKEAVKTVTEHTVPDYDPWAGYDMGGNTQQYASYYGSKSNVKTLPAVDQHEAFCQRYGYRRGDTITFVPEYFQTFGNNTITESTHGYIVGYDVDSPHIPVCISGVEIKKFLSDYSPDTKVDSLKGKRTLYSDSYVTEEVEISYFGTYMKDELGQALTYMDDANIVVPHIIVRKSFKKRISEKTLRIPQCDITKNSLTKEAFTALHSACSCCNDVWTTKMLEVVGWFDDVSPVCGACVIDLEASSIDTYARRSFEL